MAWFEKQLTQATSLQTLAHLADSAEATKSLSKLEAEHAIDLLQARYRGVLLEERQSDREANQVALGDHALVYDDTVFGDKPANGHCLVISMHGGGGAPKRVNDQQWENQKRLYRLKEGIYLAPRAPTDTWNLWQASHIDPLFTRLISNMIAFEGIDQNGYEHWVKIHQGKGHWMDRHDSEGVQWMMKFTSDLEPKKIVWVQDNVVTVHGLRP